jgi:hypothetical protein
MTAKFQTKLSDHIFDLMTAHAEGMGVAYKWMQDHGADLYHDATTAGERAEFNLTVHHENDYIEGGYIEDENYEHYYVYSWSELEVRVPLQELKGFFDALKYVVGIDAAKRKDYALSDERVYMATMTNNQFTMEDRVHFSDYSNEYCTMRLEWRVFHDFNER